MANPQKDTVYIDVDDEITAIIEKVQSSPNKIVALVLPKRAAVLQSIVNMKLLKRSADNAKKKIVLITSEAGLLPLAGAVGIYVANSLQSQPTLPPAPGAAQLKIHGPDDEAEAAEDVTDDFDSEAAKSQPVGKLAGAAGFSEPETIELDNGDTPDAGAAAGGVAAVAAAKKSKNSKLKIPNFNKFRLALILALVGVLLLTSGFVWANTALPKAVVTLKTDSSDIETNANLTLDPKATTADFETGTLPANVVSKAKTGSQQVSTTGEKNNGEKATGKVSATQVCTKKPAPISSGTGFSSGSLTYISTEALDMNPSGVDSEGNILCKGDVAVISQQAGTKYNLAAGSKFTVAGYAAISATNNAALSGGTDNIVKVVTQGDIDSAKQKVLDKDKDTTDIREELTTKLSTAGFYAIAGTFQAGEPAVSPSANVGDQTDTVSVSVVTTYTMYGAKEADLKKIITDNVKDKIDTKKQVILKDGFNQADYEITSAATSGPLQLSISAVSLAGPNIQLDKFKAQIAGKKSGEVTEIAQVTPGVTDVSVKYSPFWVSKVPKKADRIAVDIQKADQ